MGRFLESVGLENELAQVCLATHSLSHMRKGLVLEISDKVKASQPDCNRILWGKNSMEEEWVGAPCLSLSQGRQWRHETDRLTTLLIAWNHHDQKIRYSVRCHREVYVWSENRNTMGSWAMKMKNTDDDVLD